MQFDSFSTWLQMGGHGGYVFAAYGIAFAVLVYQGLAPLRKRRALRRRLMASLEGER
ncbi:MAG: heme exporter protein CcmD [Pseudomonadota bacterium]|nr:heme exporter protein CcmD [Pseudomonadota bacterium]